MKIEATTGCGTTGTVEFEKRDDGAFICVPQKSKPDTRHVVNRVRPGLWQSIYVYNGLDRGTDNFTTRKAALSDAAKYALEAMTDGR